MSFWMGLNGFVSASELMFGGFNWVASFDIVF